MELAVKAGDSHTARETLRSELIRACADRNAWRAAANFLGNEGPLRRLASCPYGYFLPRLRTALRGGPFSPRLPLLQMKCPGFGSRAAR